MQRYLGGRPRLRLCRTRRLDGGLLGQKRDLTSAVRGPQPTTVRLLAFGRRFRQTRAVVGNGDPAVEAGDQMGSELDAIQKRLRDLKQRLDAREKVIEVESAADSIASGDPVSMNPLTPPDD
jgi:hypothetical protein